MLQLDKGVEGMPGRFPPHTRPDLFPFPFQGQSQGKDLGNTLNRKGLVDIPACEEPPVHCGQRHPETAGIHLSQSRDVISHFALPFKDFCLLTDLLQK